MKKPALIPNLRDLWSQVRTWFINNWEKFEWPAVFVQELEDLFTELSTGAIENANDKNDSRDDEEACEQIKKFSVQK